MGRGGRRIGAGRKPKILPFAVRHPEPTPALAGLDPVCPVEIAGDSVAAAEWTRAIVPAIARGQITVTDRALAIAHCELWALRRSQLIEAAPYANVIAAGKNKYPMPNPALTMAAKTLHLLLTVDRELGFSPNARAYLQEHPRRPTPPRDKQRAAFFRITSG